MKKNYLILFVFLCLLPNYLLSQVVDNSVPQELIDTTLSHDKEQLQTAKFYSPFGMNLLSNFVSNISLSSAFNQGENGKVELKYNDNWLTIGLMADQKISSEASEATLLGLQGLSPGTTVGLSLQKLFWRASVSNSSFNNFQKAKESYAARNNIKDPRLLTYQEILSRGNETERKLVRNIMLRSPFFVNVNYAITKTSHTYVSDSTSLLETSREHLAPSFSVSVGMPLNTGEKFNSYLAFGYNYTVSYASGNEVTLISPFGTSGNFISQDIVFGEPVRQSDNIVNVEYRSNIKVATNNDKSVFLGIAPLASYSFDTERLAISLPVYFINGVTDDGKPTGLQGGLRIGYLTSTQSGEFSSLKEGLTTQLIVSVPFDVFGNLKQ
ncbi:hypothetical protein ACFSKU_20125 [Pontibacter silvestris]|uniref:Uncharacterized protein n=1 Tax=Pontibacter silvestris TaxID=2305183 RepID=A0ABW4X3K4_9BACT|nr:hypothetical protein [Pontibacter silvestris]MCC9134811.1 hypothetical protein [Pontibacter silvestris]